MYIKYIFNNYTSENPVYYTIRTGHQGGCFQFKICLHSLSTVNKLYDVFSSGILQSSCGCQSDSMGVLFSLTNNLKGVIPYPPTCILFYV